MATASRAAAPIRPANSRSWIKRRAYCRKCAKIEKLNTHKLRAEQIKEIAESLNIPTEDCNKLGTCEILKAHHNVLAADPERLTSEFMIGLICGEDGVKKYKSKRVISSSPGNSD